MEYERKGVDMVRNPARNERNLQLKSNLYIGLFIGSSVLNSFKVDTWNAWNSKVIPDL